MKLILGFMLTLLSAPAFANEYKNDINNFFELLAVGKSDQAVMDLYASNPYMMAIPDQIQMVRNQLGNLSGLVGKMLEVEELDTYLVGGSLVQVTYVAIHERQPIRFEFMYFKAGDEWRIYSMSFDDDLDDEIQVLARKRALSK